VGVLGVRAVVRAACCGLVGGVLVAVALTAPAEANVDWLGVNTAHAVRSGTVTPPVFYDRLTGMGGNVLREDINWNEVEPQNNSWNWTNPDREINSAPPGLGMILMFLNSPGWVRDPVENLATCGTQSPSNCRMPPAKTKLGEWMELIRTAVGPVFQPRGGDRGLERAEPEDLLATGGR
jgi:hypothetical protein